MQLLNPTLTKHIRSPSLSPGVLRPHENLLAKNGPGNQAFRAAKKAIETMAAARDEMEQAVPEIKRARGLDDDAKVACIANQSSEIYDQAKATVNTAIEIQAKSKAALEKTITAELQDPDFETPEGIALAQEIRTHISGLDDNDERGAFFRKALEKGDRRTVSAVLMGEPYLSGFSDEQFDRLRSMASNTFVPEATAQIEEIAILEAKIGWAKFSFSEEHADEFDTPRARAALDKFSSKEIAAFRRQLLPPRGPWDKRATA
jgi:hypothetical protein